MNNRFISKEQIEEIKYYLKAGRKLIFWIFALLLIFIVGHYTIDFLTHYRWMETLQFEKVYTTILFSKISIAVIGFLLFFITALVTVLWIRFTYAKHFHNPRQLPVIFQTKKATRWTAVIVSVVFGVVGSTLMQSLGWEVLLKFLNGTSFGTTDPYFNKDIGFYEFTLPFIQFIGYVLLILFAILLVATIAAYSVFQIYRISRHAQIHLSIYVLLFSLTIAFIHFIGRYNTLLTDFVNLFQKSVVHGLSYTDKVINVPKAYVLSVFVILIGLWTMYLLFKGQVTKVIMPIILYLLLLIGSQGASMVVQSFIVSPNEFTKESPFLEHNLQMTREAYALDEIVEEDHPANVSLDEEMIERNELTVNNVRLNDSRPLLDIYNQLQTFRTYYQFNDMDIDRYMIDGKYEQVFIGARELVTDDLPEQAQTWVNRNLRYTHGYGVAMSHVNRVTSQGQPEYILKNLPVEGDIEITRPQIYFGEEPYPNVIVNSKKDEFDYPTGDENATNRFSEDAGVPLQGLNRLLFAIKERSVRMLVSNQLTDESKLLMTRNIKERVEEIAPFLTYDDDPYIFIREDGTLGWLIDAYVIGQNYPYSESFGEGNYVRNSVKVEVDAYTGDVNFYVVDKEDPILQTYIKMFPTLFSDEIPEDVYAHFRYPVDLFKIQAEMYGTYHMSNLEVFYNREDFWQFPTEKYFNQDIEMEPYYITMKLPEVEEEEFILMIPYTPKNRQNMIAWMGVRNDGDHYGEMFVHRFPKQKNVYGPQQIENRINQDSYISQQLNLWSQGGSEVIRGNLLTIPIEDTVLYVEPIYIESSNESSLPEVKQVIVSYEDYIVMEETFDKALEKILAFVESGIQVPPQDGDGNLDDTDDSNAGEELPILQAEEILQQISGLFEQYESEMSEGNYSTAGQIMDQIKQLIEMVNEE